MKVPTVVNNTNLVTRKAPGIDVRQIGVGLDLNHGESTAAEQTNRRHLLPARPAYDFWERTMSMTGLRTFDETLHATNTWLHEITSRMGWDDKQKGYRLLRVCLHVLRDRLPIGEAAQLSAQLPILIRGVFFEGWRPSIVSVKKRSVEEFLAPVGDAFSNEPDFDPPAAFREFIDVMKMHVSVGEIEDVISAVPEELKGLFSDNLAA